MSEWKKTSCVLCFSNCGLEVTTEGSRILKVRRTRRILGRRGISAERGQHRLFSEQPERLKYP